MFGCRSWDKSLSSRNVDLDRPSPTLSTVTARNATVIPTGDTTQRQQNTLPEVIRVEDGSTDFRQLLKHTFLAWLSCMLDWQKLSQCCRFASHKVILQSSTDWLVLTVCDRWMKSIQQDLNSKNLSLNEAIDAAQNRPLWRLMSTSGATQSYWACQKTKNKKDLVGLIVFLESASAVILVLVITQFNDDDDDDEFNYVDDVFVANKQCFHL